MKYSKKMCMIAGAVLIACALICGCGSSGEQPTTIPVTTTPATVVPTTVPMESETKQQSDLPWDNGGKQPIEYTWEEFEALSEEHKIAFEDALGSSEFAIWKEWVQRPPMPWEIEGAKQPEEYTWEEFEALTGEQQIAFQNAMGSEAFEKWMNGPMASPWEDSGAKQPEEYTWDEFLALSPEQQIAFQNAMGAENFAAWMEQAMEQPGEYPWDEPGAKQPEEYTWEEFEALSGEHQIAFQNALGVEAFIAWFERVNP